MLICSSLTCQAKIFNVLHWKERESVIRSHDRTMQCNKNMSLWVILAVLVDLFTVFLPQWSVSTLTMLRRFMYYIILCYWPGFHTDEVVPSDFPPRALVSPPASQTLYI